MAIEVEKRGAVTLLRPGERLDLLTYAELDEILSNELAAGAEGLVLDMSRVVYMNSSALGVLNRYRQEAESMGARLVLARTSPEAERIFRMVGFDLLFTMTEDVDAALTRAAEG